MKQLIKYYLALTFLLLGSTMYAQQIFKGEIDINNSSMERKGNSVKVDMDIDLAKIKLRSNRFLTLTPVITNGVDSLFLDDILINGRTRNKAFNRSMALKKEQLEEYSPHIITKSTDHDNLSYSVTTEYQPWMKEAKLTIQEVLCGCGAHLEEVAFTPLITAPLVPPIYTIIPQYGYITPEVELHKSRGNELELFLNFPVNKTNILENYMTNSSELSRLEKALSELKKDKHLQINSIQIVGYASPEGGVAYNERLSKGRAEALKQYLVSKSDFSAEQYSVKYGGENWAGLVEALTEMDLSEKEDLLSIINDTENLTTRKNKLKAYKGGVTYRKLLTEVYPGLRKVLLDVRYDVESFSTTEAKEIIKTRPDLLSLSEMFAVANTYAPDSKEFYNTMKIAVNQYPKDKSANLNAALAAITQQDLSSAEKYLNNSDQNSAEYANAMGLLLIQKGEWNAAKKELEKAERLGLKEAKHNLAELLKKIKIEQG